MWALYNLNKSNTLFYSSCRSAELVSTSAVPKRLDSQGRVIPDYIGQEYVIDADSDTDRRQIRMEMHFCEVRLNPS